ncbi:MAG: divalent-cation tolerance protein CutA [Bdellovibrionales bacterium]|nr:divalent-cation tolerance protein CutA [Bdellovibrionales bacterium]
MDEICLIYSTFPTRKAASVIIDSLLQQELIACANVFSSMESAYRWQGEIKYSMEVGVFFKTRQKLYADVEYVIKELHPFENPAILLVPVQNSSEDYHKWILDSCTLNPR